MSEREKFYDEQIAPKVKELAELCAAHNMSVVCVVEFEKDARGGTYSLLPDAGTAMHMVRLCGQSGENVDRYLLSLNKYVKQNNIDYSQSIYMNMINSF